jgi:hypothetical protein
MSTPFYRAIGKDTRDALNALRADLKTQERQEWTRGKAIADAKAAEREVAKANSRLSRNLNQSRGWAVVPVKANPVKPAGVIKGSVFTRKQLQDIEAELLKGAEEA